MYKQNNKVLESIIKTLAYAEIFNYPMTAFEIHRYLISDKRVSLAKVYEELAGSGVFQRSEDYFSLRNVEDLVKKRKLRIAYSRKKLARAFFIANLLSFIPTIKLIGVSGSLSMMNADLHDDIDLFFITRKNSLWMTRFFVTGLLFLLRQKRARGSKYAANKICPNMFIAEGNLGFKKKEQNLYIAHEISQLKILFDRGNTHLQFLSQNKWVNNILPNTGNVDSLKFKRERSILNFPIILLEKIFFVTQNAYMKKHRTIEQVEYGRAGFHPQDRKNGIIEMYTLKCKYYLQIIRRSKVDFRHKFALN